MNEDADNVQRLFDRDHANYLDQGFSDRVTLRLRRRMLVRRYVLFGATLVGSFIFLLQVLRANRFLANTLESSLSMVNGSLSDLVAHHAELGLQLAIVFYVVFATITVLIQSVNPRTSSQN